MQHKLEGKISKDSLLQNKLTEKGLKQLAAQDGRHFAHAGLQGLFLWTGQVGLVLLEQPHCPSCVCLTK